jgi:hypothetical protein
LRLQALLAFHRLSPVLLSCVQGREGCGCSVPATNFLLLELSHSQYSSSNGAKHAAPCSGQTHIAD